MDWNCLYLTSYSNFSMRLIPSWEFYHLRTCYLSTNINFNLNDCRWKLFKAENILKNILTTPLYNIRSLENWYFTKIFSEYILLEVYIISWANLFQTKQSKRKKIPLKILIESDLSKSKVSLFRKRIADWNVIRATVIELLSGKKKL